MSEYTRATIAFLKAKARQLVKDEKAEVTHVFPRVYCVAKITPHCAIFAVPTCDREPQVAEDGWNVVNNESCAEVKVGDWCSVAYISFRSDGGSHVLRILKPKAGTK